MEVEKDTYDRSLRLAALVSSRSVARRGLAPRQVPRSLLSLNLSMVTGRRSNFSWETLISHYRKNHHLFLGVNTQVLFLELALWPIVTHSP